jgi:N-acetylmuramoyl-L-alanine amidase
VRARCLGGNAVAPPAVFFEIRRPPAEIHAEPWPAWNGGPRPGPLGLKLRVRDRLGLAVADSTPVEVTSPAAVRAFTRGGEAWVQVPPGNPATSAWQVRAGGVEKSVSLVTSGAPPAWSGRLGDVRNGAPVAGAELRDGEGGPFLGHTSPEGGYAVRAPISGQLAITAPGYLPALVPEGGRIAPSLVPALGGVLHGRTIVVDAAGGGSEPLFVSATGVRAADTTLDIARRLAGELRRAGARAELTRADDRTLPELARVEAAERVRAELVVRLSTGREPKIRHYPGSSRGARLAAACARELQVEAGTTLPVQAEVTPVLQQTSMPAVEILLPPPATLAAEARDLDLDYRRRVARALIFALAAEAGFDPAAQGTALVTSKAPRVLVDGVTVLPIGGSLVLRGLEPAPTRHRAAALDPLRGSGKPVEFAVGAGDTFRLTLP